MHQKWQKYKSLEMEKLTSTLLLEIGTIPHLHFKIKFSKKQIKNTFDL
jgi:hypothetical protein